MKHKSAIINRLVLTVQQLGALVDEFVFVGGSVVPLLITDEAAPEPRPTKDVDVIVRVLRKVDYYLVQDRLAEVGFVVRMGEDVICRFRNGDLVLDVMPTKEEILNFSNRWYESAMDNHFLYKLFDDKEIKVINAPYFLCTKFEAYQDRGGEDEKDLEDIIYVIDGRPELINELRNSPWDARAYIAAATNSVIGTGLLSEFLERWTEIGHRLPDHVEHATGKFFPHSK
jgi:predicted nucleotidyltransferase